MGQLERNKIDMEIFELAEKLGDALKEDARLIALEEAKKAYEQDVKLQKSMMEYEVQQQALQREAGKAEHDLHFMETIQARIETLYQAIIENPTFAALNKAQEAVNSLMNEVNQTIMTRITGEQPTSGCTHNCSTCGGCH